jgi:hypothetical protein
MLLLVARQQQQQQRDMQGLHRQGTAERRTFYAVRVVLQVAAMQQQLQQLALVAQQQA